MTYEHIFDFINALLDIPEITYTLEYEGEYVMLSKVRSDERFILAEFYLKPTGGELTSLHVRRQSKEPLEHYGDLTPFGLEMALSDYLNFLN